MLSSIRILLTSNFYGTAPNGLFIPLSADGKFASLTAYRPLLAPDTNTVSDIYLLNNLSEAYSLASITPGGTIGADGSVKGMVSGDATRVVFSTFAQNLSGASISNGVVVVKDLASGALLRVDRSAAGVDGNSGAGNPSLSSDGRYVSFAGYGSNLVPNDSNGSGDIFVKDLLTGAIVMASITASGVQGNSESLDSAISGNGTVVAFSSNASNFHSVLPGARAQVYRKELDSGKLALMSASHAGEVANYASYFESMSADGRWVGFQSGASNLVPSSKTISTQLYAKDAATGFVRLVSSAADGTPGNNYSGELSFSADGRFAVFSSEASNLVAEDTNGMRDIFLKDLLSGAVTRLSTSLSGAQANKGSMSPSISADASTVTFISQASNLTPDINTTDDAFLATIDRAFLTAWTGLLAGDETSGDSLLGTAGNDRLMGLGGNDVIDGAAGIDTAVLRGYLANYGIVRNPDGSVTVTDKTGLEGTDILHNLERLHFDNASIALDIHGTGGQAYRLYQAAFNRTPDAGGLGFWIAQMDKGTSLDTVAANFMASAEFQAAYGATPTNAALVEKFYVNVLHRAGEAAGVAYWIDALERQLVTPQQVLGMISESAENQAALIGVMQNGFSYLPFP